MNPKALLQLGAELLHDFRHAGMPADKAIAEYMRARKFLGPNDRKFITDNFYHLLRNLRRYDEAIEGSFARTAISQHSFEAGYPVSTEEGAMTWWRHDRGDRRNANKQTEHIRALDTVRLGLAAVELEAIAPHLVPQELFRTWPKDFGGVQTAKQDTIERMFQRAMELATQYAEPDDPIHLDRTFSFPGWLWGKMTVGRNNDELKGLAAALNQQAPFTLRVNTLRTTIEAAERALAAAGIPSRRGKLAPNALVLEGRQARSAIPHMNDGWFEVQDEGSQMVPIFAGVRPGMIAIDACAGGGGKTLQMSAMMENEGSIYAFDIDPDRLANLFRRSGRAGAENIEGSLKLNMDGTPPPATLLPAADVVLIDAPCSGIGTLRRAPEQRWRLTPGLFEELKLRQSGLLDTWAPRVKLGGHLVYATCSTLADENSHQADQFLLRHPEFAIDPPAHFAGPLTNRGEFQALPHREGCDGFYAVRFVRTRETAGA